MASPEVNPLADCDTDSEAVALDLVLQYFRGTHVLSDTEAEALEAL